MNLGEVDAYRMQKDRLMRNGYDYSVHQNNDSEQYPMKMKESKDPEKMPNPFGSREPSKEINV